MAKAAVVASGGVGIGFLAGSGLKPEEVASAATWMFEKLGASTFVSLSFNILQGLVLAFLFVYFQKKDLEKRNDVKEAFGDVLKLGERVHAAIDRHSEALAKFRVALASLGIITDMERSAPALGGHQGGSQNGGHSTGGVP